MTGPTLKIIGVYRPHITFDKWNEQFQVTNDRGRTREDFDKLALIEGIVDGLDEPFDMSRFGQMQTQVPDDPKPMQVGYDEGLLSEDGDTLTDRKMNCVQGTGPLRFVVYLHQFDAQRPLRWQRGEVMCPPIQEIPLRLLLLMPYNVRN